MPHCIALAYARGYDTRSILVAERLLFRPQPQLLQLLFANGRRRSQHDVRGFEGLRERHAFGDGVFAEEVHDDAVDAGGDAAVLMMLV